MGDRPADDDPPIHSEDMMLDDTAPRGEVEEGLRNVYRQLVSQSLMNAEFSATLRALIDTLVQSGSLPPDRFEQRRQKQLDKVAERVRTRPVVRLEQYVDKYALEDLPDVPCAELIPICKARCCRLKVTLSAQDLDEKVFLWDYADPYHLRKKPDGYCVHSDTGTRNCGVYARRPAICRSYDCRTDYRIWRDFERRILATDPE